MSQVTRQDNEVQSFLGIFERCQEQQEPIIGQGNEADIDIGDQGNEFFPVPLAQVFCHLVDPFVQSAINQVAPATPKIEKEHITECQADTTDQGNKERIQSGGNTCNQQAVKRHCSEG